MQFFNINGIAVLLISCDVSPKWTNSLYSDKPIHQHYIDVLTDIKNGITFMKIKFKIMDILEKR